MIKLNAQELRTTKTDVEELPKLKKNPIYIILDNVLDTYNIGSIFRLADAIAAEEVIICGQSEIPPNTRIKKASINTTEWVKWQYASTAVEAIAKIKNQKFPPIGGIPPKAVTKIKIIAVEQDKRSVPYTEMRWEFPVAVVVGNETNGISREALEMCDAIVEIPMFGVNISLNVMVSLGIVLYKILDKN